MAVELVQIPFSPWSVRARWALLQAGVPHSCTAYKGDMTIWWLRLKLSRWRISMPVLLTGKEALTESFEIARFADANKSCEATSLCMPGVNEWVDSMEIFMCSERTRGLTDALHDPSPFVPPNMRWLGPVGPWMVRRTMKSLLNKYPAMYDEAIVRSQLEKLRAAINKQPSHAPYLLGAFSFADIVAVCALQLLKPAASSYIKMPNAFSTLFTHSELIPDFGDLLQWRDSILEKHWVAPS